MPVPPSSRDVAALLQVMRDLRDPDSGCPWDVEQTFETIAPYTIEEAYEVADAIGRGATDELCDELGDLLLQVVYHARMAEEAGLFRFDDVVRAIVDKMVRRHPHVYGEAAHEGRAALAKGFWERTKADERAQGNKNGDGRSEGVLDGVAVALPALTRAVKLQRRAARVGFDWPDTKPVFDKMREEVGELEEALDGGRQSDVEHELGDLMFVIANLGRHMGVDPEAALSRANGRFIERFEHIESSLSEQGRKPDDASLEEMEALWQEAKRLARAAQASEGSRSS